MYFKQFYLGCLAHASYLIGSDGEAAVVDPQRDVDQYIREAEANGLKIKYVIETHLHADFVSGHRELAARTGAEIIFGERAEVTFPYRPAHDEEEIKIGTVTLRILETPGHTPESISIFIADSEPSNEPAKVLTGDTLFIGDVGRPDLAGAKGYTPQMMAAMLYDSLHQKLLELPDAVEVYPAHGAGSMCGRNMSKETSSTIGEQKRLNYALKPMTKEQFVRLMTTDLPEAPSYFARDAEINRTGAASLEGLRKPTTLSGTQVSELIANDTLVLDVRSSSEFGAGHIPKSLNIGLGGQFAMWAGSLIPLSTHIVVVAESEEQVEEAVVRLARVGIEGVIGYLRDGIYGWHEAGFPTATVPQISVEELAELVSSKANLQILDVRRPAEYENGHVPGALEASLSHLRERILDHSLSRKTLTAVICAGGYRSSAATSILEQEGFVELRNVMGGTSAWINAGYPVEPLS